MGNENTKSTELSKEDIQTALRKQQEIFDIRYQQLLTHQREQHNKQHKEAIGVAIEALEIEKKKYEKKCKELQEQVVQTQHGVSVNNLHYMGHFMKIQESRQNAATIYPNFDGVATCPGHEWNTISTPTIHGPNNVNFKTRFPNTVPTAPPVDFTPSLAISGSRVTVENRCRSCNRIFGNQVFQCRNKHNSCMHCRMGQVACGVCMQKITDFRNYALERRLAGRTTHVDAKQQCPNSVDGCRLKFKEQDMPAHLKECLFSDVICPLMYMKIGLCSWKGKISQLRVHFDQQHPEHCEADVDKEMILLNCKDNSHIVYFVSLGAYKFLVHVKVDSVQNIILMTAQMFGTQFTAEKWAYQFHVYNKATPKRKYQYNGVCHSNAIDVNDIFAEANCAVLHSRLAYSFADKNQLTYKFYLKQLFSNREENKPQASSS